MNYYYTIEASNCMNPSIKFSYNGLDLDTAIKYKKVLEGGFCDIRINCEETGEVMCSVYYAEEVFIRTKSEAEAIIELYAYEQCLKEMESE